jgi:hypothetical protein
MKTTILALLVLPPFCIGAQPDTPQAEWRPAPDFNEGDRNWVILPQTDIYEVGASQMSNYRVRELPEWGFKELTVGEAEVLTGNHYSCPMGKRPFLVRALYGQEGIGSFRVERKENSLVVIWVCFPAITHHGIGESALVVNLEAAPNLELTPIEIYNQWSSIQ